MITGGLTNSTSQSLAAEKERTGWQQRPRHVQHSPSLLPRHRACGCEVTLLGDGATEKVYSNGTVIVTTKNWTNPNPWLEGRKMIMSMLTWRCRRSKLTLIDDSPKLNHESIRS